MIEPAQEHEVERGAGEPPVRERGARRPHQCMLVELKSTAAPGLTFTNSSVYRNMDLVSASTFSRDALLSVKGIAAAVVGHHDLYLYVETRDMPTRVKPRGQSDAAAITTGATAAEPPDRDRPLPSYRVHVYRDTGGVLSIGGTTRPVLSYQTSFGYDVTHTGEIEGWRHEIEGAGLLKLAPDWYRIQVPNGGEVPVTTKIEAVEPAGPWSLSLHMGGNVPVGQSGRYSSGPGGGVDLEYRLNTTYALEAFLGLDGLGGKAGTADLRVTQLYVSGKVYLLPGTIRPFALAGVGGYGLDPGSWEAGIHAGGGVQFDLSPRVAVEVAAKYHDVPSPTPALQFVTFQVGVRLRF